MADLKGSAATTVVPTGTTRFLASHGGLDRVVLGSDLAAFVSPAMSDTVAGIVEAAIQAEQEAGTSLVVAVTPGRQQYHPSAIKCWGKATVATGVPTLAASYNMTSITDTGVGQITFTINVDFSSANWSCTATVERASTLLTVANIRDCGIRNTGQAAGTVLIECWDDTATTHAAADPAAWHFQGAGDQ